MSILNLPIFLPHILLNPSFASCVVEDNPTKEKYEVSDNNAETVQTETEKVKDEVFGLNESAVFKNIKITAIDFAESHGESFYEPDEGNVFVGIKFEIENISDETQSTSTLLLFDGYVDDVKVSYSFNAQMAFNEGTLDGEILPNKKLVGWYAIEVPENWEKVELSVKSEWLSSSSAVFAFEKTK